MIRKSFTLLALALAAAAVAVPIAQASPGPKIDPLAVGYLIGQGYTPSQIHAWTVGVCSHEAKPAACFGPSKGAVLTNGVTKVDPFAVSYLTGLGLTSNEVTSWTVGACSHKAKDASCYAMLERASATAAPTQFVRSIGFHWGDAGIGAGFTLGILLLLAGAAGVLISRQNRSRKTAQA
jgi:hypothetical protein